MVRGTGAFGAVRFPVYPPTGADDEVTAKVPIETPVLEHVHGFHVSARPPVLFVAERQAAVAAGKLIVLIDLDTRRQEFIRGHTESVSCLAFSLEQGFGASGQLRSSGSKFAEVLLWSAEELQPCASLEFHQADIETIGFVRSGEALVTISADRDHTLAVWSVAKDRALRARRREKVPLSVCSAYKSGLVHGVLGAADRAGQAQQFVTFGDAHVKFWKCDRLSSSLASRRGAFGPEGAPRAVVHVAWTSGGKLVAGGSEGQIYFFEGTRAIRRLHQQTQAVALMVPLRDALLVVYAHGLCSLLRGGGSSAEPRSVDVDLSALPGAPDVRMQSPIVGGKAWRQSTLLLASRTHLMLVDLSGGLRETCSCETLLAQPSKPITAVCAHPAEPRFFTGSLDGGVRCYRSDTHEPLPERSFKASSGVTCLALSGSAPGSAAWLAVGCEDSTLAVLGEASLNYAFRRCLSGRGDRRAHLTCARFSACDCSGSHPLWLAVGTDDGSIHTFRFKDPACRYESHTGPETVVKVATLRGHASAVVEISFASTLPCCNLVSVDRSGQALAFDVPMGRRLSSVALVRDVPFTPWTLPVGWQVLGCWAPEPAPADPSSSLLPARRFAEISRRSLVAASDATSPAVELFPFPCPTAPILPTPRLDGPASPVTALLHSARSDRLLAASGALVFVWGWQMKLGRDSPSSPDHDVKSPLRPVQHGGVVLDTPEGQKHAYAAKNSGLLLTPEPRRNSEWDGGSSTKENLAVDRAPMPAEASKTNVGPPWALHADGDQAPATPPSSPPAHALWPGNADGRRPSSAPPRRLANAERQKASPEASAPAPPLEPGLRQAHMPEVEPLPGEQPERFPGRDPQLQAHPGRQLEFADRDEAFLAGALPLPGGDAGSDRPLPVFYLGGAPQETCMVEAAHPRVRSRLASNHLVSPKVGARENGLFGQVARNTQWVREDTEARAKSVHERQRCDTVGMLIGGYGPSGRQRSHSVGAVTAADTTSEDNAAGNTRNGAREGRWLYRPAPRGYDWAPSWAGKEF